jgi:hypothetical protein
MLNNGILPLLNSCKHSEREVTLQSRKVQWTQKYFPSHIGTATTNAAELVLGIDLNCFSVNALVSEERRGMVVGEGEPLSHNCFKTAMQCLHFNVKGVVYETPQP